MKLLKEIIGMYVYCINVLVMLVSALFVFIGWLVIPLFAYEMRDWRILLFYLIYPLMIALSSVTSNYVAANSEKGKEDTNGTKRSL